MKSALKAFATSSILLFVAVSLLACQSEEKKEEPAPKIVEPVKLTGPPGLAAVARKGAEDPKVVIIESSEFQ